MTTDVFVDYKLLGFLRALFRIALGDSTGNIHGACVRSTWTQPAAPRGEGLHLGALLYMYMYMYLVKLAP